MNRQVDVVAGAGKGVKVIACTCDHEYQDKKYGKGMRVHNPMKSGYRCTVCGREKDK